MKAGDRRLIEDYLPLDVLNAIASKEKLHPRHYVSLIHYWPARRPTTACRAAIYAALVPAPSTDEKREEAASFVTKLAAFKPDPKVVKKASDRIRKSHEGEAPKILDMFAGGGAIPLEAARLGCESHAQDYNPVAHLIELCTLVYPQTYGPSLADDFQSWGKVVFERMRKELNDLYPPIQLLETEDVNPQIKLFGSGDTQLALSNEPVAYIWARTVPCRRPGCDAPVPLVRQAWLRKKGGAVAAVPRIENGRDLRWEIVSGSSAKEVSAQEKQTGAGQAVCIACDTPGGMQESLAAVRLREGNVQGRASHRVACCRSRTGLSITATHCALHLGEAHSARRTLQDLSATKHQRTSARRRRLASVLVGSTSFWRRNLPRSLETDRTPPSQ